MSSATVDDATVETVTTEGRLAARRERFRAAVARLSEKTQSTELLRLLLAPAGFAVVGGFAFMFLGWWGAARTTREIEQVPYLISGGLIGLGLVFVGGLLLASAFWMTMLQRFHEEAEERRSRQLEAVEDRLRGEIEAARPRSRASSRSKRDTGRTKARTRTKRASS